MTAHLPTAGVSPWKYATSMLGLGPVPFTQIVHMMSLMDEANRTTEAHSCTQLTHVEDRVRIKVEHRSNRHMQKQAAHEVEPKIAAASAVYAEIEVIREQITQTQTRRIITRQRDSLEVEEAEKRADQLREDILEAVAGGDVRHEHTPETTKRTAKGLQLMDFFVLLFVMLKVLNVDLAHFYTSVGGSVKAGSALALSVFGTMAVALTMGALGRRHRPYRNADGGVQFPAGMRFRGVVETVLAVSIPVLIAAVMSWRFIVEGRAIDEPVLTILLAALFAVVIGATAYLSYVSDLSDGSPELEELEAIAGQIHTISVDTENLGKRDEVLVQQLYRQVDELIRRATEIKTTSRLAVTGSSADAVIRLARAMHQKAGASGEMPEPRLDYTTLDLAIEQAQALADALDRLNDPDPDTSALRAVA